jgi:SAM-dependent methyltransferase
VTTAYQALLERERAGFLDPASGRLSAAVSRAVTCPLCEDAPPDQRELFVTTGYRFVRCTGCGLLFVNPMLRESAGLPLYDGAGSVAEWARVVQSDGQRAFDLSLYRALADLVGADAPGPSSTCLDISMRAGTALACPELAAWRVECLDFARATRELGRSRHAGRTFHASLDDIAASRRYDIAVSFEALEHAFAPVSFVSRVRGLLADGGVFCGVLSNVESLLVRVLGAEAPLFDGIYQKYFFHTGSLGWLLRRTGFTDVRFRTALPCTQQIVETLGRLVADGPELPSRAAIEKLAQAAESTPLGYKLLFVARKAPAAGAGSSPGECRRYSPSRR